MQTVNGVRPRPANYTRELLIDNSFQLKFALILAGVAIVTSALTAFTVMLVQRQAQSIFAIVAGIAVILASSILVVLISIVISHRLVGPLFVMTGFLSKLAKGSYPALRPIRGDDQLQDFYRLLRNSIETLRARELEEVFKLQEAAQVFAPLAVTAETRASLDYLRSMLERKRASLATGEQNDLTSMQVASVRN